MWATIIFLLTFLSPILVDSACLPPDQRFDCHPEPSPSQEKCEARGCCWDRMKRNPPNVPSCSYPDQYGGYRTTIVTDTDTGRVAYLQRSFPSPYPRDVATLKAEAFYLSNSIVRVRITDTAADRFEAPYPKIQNVNLPADDRIYEIVFEEDSSGFKVSRSNGVDIFNSLNVAAFTYADQFIEISTTLAESSKLLGVGEHRTNLSLPLDWQRYTLFNHEHGPSENTNLYGSHPFYLASDASGLFYGVFLHNSNAMEILTSPLPSLTFRTIGGILDFYFFLGPTPDQVVQQYTSIIGRPYLPPYWGLGFHLCRFGYGGTNATRDVWERNRGIIPYDVQWNDIDYMDRRNGFTLADSYADIADLVDDIHDARMRYIMIVDAGISASEPAGSYQPYDLGIEMDVLVKNKSGQVLVGKAWNPINAAWPDFFHPKSEAYWTTLIKDFHARVPFDGIWLDVNEPQNFVDGSVDGCPDDELENPPYTPDVVGEKLNTGTFCMNAKQTAGSHYNVHNLYSITEAEATHNALRSLGKRPFVISRSTFSGSGRYTGHWSGDNTASWYDLGKSIQELLIFNIYGIPLMGADICGFRGNTNRELCNRWFQLGAFYTFARNHNDLGLDEQDPAVFDKETISSIQRSLVMRYQLLPYLYTKFYEAHVNGSTVARPVFFEFPNDPKAYETENAFFWGSALYVCPVVTENATSVDVYLPEGRWYDMYLGTEYKGSQTIVYDAAYDIIPLIIRGGHVLPMQGAAFTTDESREKGLIILAASDAQYTGKGRLYWDDGLVIDPIENDVYGVVEYILANNSLTQTVTHWTAGAAPMIHTIMVAGIVPANYTRLSINGVSEGWAWGVDQQNSLVVANLVIPINASFIMEWS